MSLSATELIRYSRHLSLTSFGPTAQLRLKQAGVLVIGAGGLGAPALLYLAAAGVGRLGIVEFDRVDLSNLQRQVLFDTAAVGQSKAEQARLRLQALNPHVSITVHDTALHADNVLTLLRDYDVIVDGTDQFGIRYLINDACVILGKPLVSAAIHRFEGQAFSMVPRHSPCYRCLFPQPPAPEAVPNCAEAGVLGVLPGVMGTIQATEAIKLLTGLGSPLLGRLLTYNALDMRFDEFAFSKQADCAVCGANASITTPTLASETCRTEPITESVTRFATISVQELATRLTQPANHQPTMQLIDVREPHEFAAGHVAGAVNLPLSELPEHMAQLPKQTLIFMCKAGGRSLQACQLVSAQRPDADIINVSGGTLAWQAHIDASLCVL